MSSVVKEQLFFMALLGALSVAMRVNFFVSLGLIGVLNVRAHIYKSFLNKSCTFSTSLRERSSVNVIDSLDLRFALSMGRC